MPEASDFDAEQLAARKVRDWAFRYDHQILRLGCKSLKVHRWGQAGLRQCRDPRRLFAQPWRPGRDVVSGHMVDTHWQPAWWTDKHSSSWERVKHALRRDWEQTKGDLADNGVDLNQGACDTIRQALGKQPIPKGALPNPGPRHAPDPPQGASSARPELESAMRYGHGARLYYEGHDWNDQLSARLKGEWEDGNQASSWDEVKAVVERGWRSVKRAL